MNQQSKETSFTKDHVKSTKDEFAEQRPEGVKSFVLFLKPGLAM
jgi:hypothetical protein